MATKTVVNKDPRYKGVESITLNVANSGDPSKPKERFDTVIVFGKALDYPDIVISTLQDFKCLIRNDQTKLMELKPMYAIT
jgi:hypothetical protein